MMIEVGTHCELENWSSQAYGALLC